MATSGRRWDRLHRVRCPVIPFAWQCPDAAIHLTGNRDMSRQMERLPHKSQAVRANHPGPAVVMCAGECNGPKAETASQAQPNKRSQTLDFRQKSESVRRFRRFSQIEEQWSDRLSPFLSHLRNLRTLFSLGSTFVGDPFHRADPIRRHHFGMGIHSLRGPVKRCSLPSGFPCLLVAQSSPVGCPPCCG